ELLKASSIVPMANQVEFSPFLYQKELLAFCTSHKIVVEAYSPLTRGKRLDDKKLVSVAATYKRTPAQIMLRWALQHDLVILPKSTHAARIKENCALYDFTLSGSDMKTIDALNEDARYCWDPNTVD
ncbi:MAG: aldo/keto reductase, partial [Nanoarchaeota archaeon]